MDFYIKLFSALLTPLIAIITTYIAVQQYKLQKLKLRKELFDRRLVVYKAIMEYMAGIKQSDNSADNDSIRLLRETSDAHFLFKSDITDFIKILYNKGREIAEVNSKLQNNMINNEQKKAEGDKKIELKKFFEEQFDIANKKFHEYLAVDI